MTNLEYVKAIMGANYPLDDAFFLAVLSGNDIDPTADYEKGRAFDVAFANSLLFMLTSAESISEGGYTVKLNFDAISTLISWYFRKWGLPDPFAKTSVVDITNQW